ncbi:hypothetical protein AHF37_02352 [Paragonimus kellicotti]|nr:hypothetical protein AHF37_02352 [Paragonimus kellicotti]
MLSISYTVPVDCVGYSFFRERDKSTVMTPSIAVSGTHLRLIFFKALAFDFVGTWLIDRLLVLVFGRVQKKPL